MAINISNFESGLQAKLNSYTSSDSASDALLLAKAIDSIDADQIRSFANYAALPSVSSNTGQIVYVTDSDSLFFSNGTTWTKIATGDIDALETRLDSEVLALENADSALGTRIDSEVLVLENADSALGTRIDSEVLVLENADSALGTRIDSEALVVEALETRLDSEIAVQQAYTDTAISNLVDGAPLALDTLNELATALGDDSDALAALTTTVDAQSTRLDSEVLALENADSALGTRIDSEALVVEALTTTVDGKLSSSSSIDDLSDVDTTTTAPTDGQVLAWSADDSEWAPADGAGSINDLSDVDTTTTPPTDGQMLAWSSTDSEWAPADAASGGGIATFVDSDSEIVAATGASYSFTISGTATSSSILSMGVPNVSGSGYSGASNNITSGTNAEAIVTQFAGGNAPTGYTISSSITSSTEATLTFTADYIFSNSTEPAVLAQPTGLTITVSTTPGADEVRGISTADIASPEDGQMAYASNNDRLYIYNGTSWNNQLSSCSSIDNLNDVDTTSIAPTDGQVLTWSADDSEWAPADGGAHSIDDLSDVDTTSTAPTNGQILVWCCSGLGCWKPADLSDGPDYLLGDGTATCAIACNIALGDRASAVGGSYSVAVGFQACTTQCESVAMGCGASSCSIRSVSIGAGSCTTSDYSVAYGRAAQARSNWDVAIGTSSYTGPLAYNVAIGGAARACYYGTAIGYKACSKAEGVISIGFCARACSAGSMALGHCTWICSTYPGSIALGYCAKPHRCNQLYISCDSNYGICCIAACKVEHLQLANNWCLVNDGTNLMFYKGINKVASLSCLGVWKTWNDQIECTTP